MDASLAAMLERHATDICGFPSFIGTVIDVQLPDEEDFVEVDVSRHSEVFFRIDADLADHVDDSIMILWPARRYEDDTWSHRAGWEVADIGDRFLVVRSEPDELSWWTYAMAAESIGDGVTLPDPAVLHEHVHGLCSE